MFPGESVRIDWANIVAGTAPEGWDDGFEWWYRRDEYSTVIASGTAFIAGFYDYEYLPSGTEAVEASLVVETAGSSSGAFSVATGWDPDWDLENPALAAQALGSHTADGAQTLVIPIPAFDIARFYDQDEQFIAHIQVTGGSVDFDQLRLRLWPPGGFLGGWTAGPPAQDEVAPGAARYEAAGVGLVPGLYNHESALALASADYDSKAGTAVTSTTTISGVTFRMQSTFGRVEDFIDPADLNPYTRVIVEAGGFWIGSNHDRIVDFVHGLNPGRHPDFVRFEPGGSFQMPDGSLPLWQFSGWNGDLRVSGSYGVGGVCGYIDFGSWSDWPANPTLPVVPSGSPVGVGVSYMPFPPQPRVLVRTASASWYDGTEGDASFTVGLSNEVRMTFETPAGYLYWDPDAPSAEPVEPPLRQIQRDDNANGFSAGAWTGASSKQQSNRWIGYL